MTTHTVSPLAPQTIATLPPIAGFDIATEASGLRYKGRDDLLILRGAPGTEIAGVFTQNAMPGAPIDWTRNALTYSPDPKSPRLIIVNAGNANVFTGAKGPRACQAMAEKAAAIFGGAAKAVCLGSTGVIGLALNADRLTACFPAMVERMQADGWNKAAQAIMTTDTFSKTATRTALIDDIPVTLNGIAKGSGMIAPEMATMLAFIATDAALPQTLLQALLSEGIQSSFNAITVDSDTSTSDMVLLAASGAANHKPITQANDSRLLAFRAALFNLMQDLARQIVSDGEGASKFITVNISGADTDKSARIIALAIANSPLVKTAIAGEDANWGRIVMAVGKSGQRADRDRLTVGLGPHILARQGELCPDYTEADGAAYMKNSHIDIHVDLGLGDGTYTAWTCDLTHGYIAINADYRS